MTLPYSNPQIINSIKKIIFELGNLKQSESLYIITDNSTKAIGDIFVTVSSNYGIHCTHDSTPIAEMHGHEPPETISKRMKENDLIIGLTKFSLAHTNARREAEILGMRYLSLADFSEEILTHPALLTDYRECSKNAESLSKKLTLGNKLEIKTKAGTDMKFDISTRNGNFAPGYVNEKIKLGSPPDIEANISPIEENSNGVVIVDGSIPHPKLGKLSKPVTLTILNGTIESIECEEPTKTTLVSLFEKYGKKSKMLAEVGIGFNTKARVIGNMLMDEGSFGTMHFGFGSNTSLGGKNEINFHLDFVFYCRELYIDGQLIKMDDVD